MHVSSAVSFSTALLFVAISVNSQLISNEEAKCKALATCEKCGTEPLRCQWCGSENTCHSTLNFMKFECSIQSSCPSSGEEASNIADTCTRTETESIPSSGDSALIAFAAIFGAIFAFATALYCVSCFGSPSYTMSEIANLNADNPPTAQGIEMSGSFASKSTSNGDRYAIKSNSDASNDLVLYDESDPRGINQTNASSQSGKKPSRMVPTCRSFVLNNKKWFGFTALIAFIAAITFSVVLLYPSQPTVNICSTELAWRELMTGAITSGKVEAPFDLLLSVRNPNVVDVDINLKTGVIGYDAKDGKPETSFGSFDVDALQIKANTITDVMVNVTVYPTRVQRPLLMMEQFLANTLEFQVTAEMTVTLPSLFRFKSQHTWVGAIDFALRDVATLIKGENDRELCLCQF